MLEIQSAQNVKPLEGLGIKRFNKNGAVEVAVQPPSEEAAWEACFRLLESWLESRNVGRKLSDRRYLSS